MLRRNSANNVLECICRIPQVTEHSLHGSCGEKGYVTQPPLDLAEMTWVFSMFLVLLESTDLWISDYVQLDCLRSSERIIPKKKFWYVTRDAELFGCLTKEKIIGKIYFTFIGWQVEKSCMPLGIVFNLLSQDAMSYVFNLPMNFCCCSS